MGLQRKNAASGGLALTNRGDVLESWKSIAFYLGRKVRTCQKWEQSMGLPVHRLDDSPKARVFAYTEELSRWREERLKEGASNGATMTARPRRAALHVLPRWNKALILGLIVLALSAVAVSFGLVYRQSRIRWANEVVLPEIERLLLDSDGERAFELAERVRGILAGSPSLARIMPLVSGTLSVESDPAAADISVRPYGKPAEPWKRIGRTPLSGRALSPGYKHWKVERPGFAPAEGVVHVRAGRDQTLKLTLDDAKSAPRGMVRVRGGTADLPYVQLRYAPALELGDFWIDKYEVTNAEFRAFVDAGGYREPRYWKYPVMSGGRVLTREEAKKVFVDRTGRPGPATWEFGGYPPGMDLFPVTGVSWYEAAAYAEFAGKRLPSVYHWAFASGAPDEIGYVVPLSNLEGRALAPVGAFVGLSAFGAYDMAGNAKEWCANEAQGRRANLGGSWDMSEAVFGGFESFPPLMRPRDFGFRCMKTVGDQAGVEAAFGPLAVAGEPEFGKKKPCSDDAFNAYRELYACSEAPLDARLESREIWSPGAILEKVSVADPEGGGSGRLNIYIFIPRHSPPPFQSMVYLPGSSIAEPSPALDSGMIKSREVEIFTRGGRAFVLPDLGGAFGPRPVPLTREFLRGRIIRLHRGLVRSLDYLETGPDFDKTRIAYVGAGVGAWTGPIHLALEHRFRAAALLGGGFHWEMYEPATASPEWDLVNFAPRVTIPVIMMNGEFDSCFRLETNARPLFRMLGTADRDKVLRVYPTGHSIWFLNEYRRDLMDFLDMRLGPVETGTGTPAKK